MKKIILILCTCCWSIQMFAQKVEPNTRIINCSDMSANIYTNVKRRCPVPDHEKNDRLNQTVYQRFEVAEHNYQNVALGTDRNEAKRLCASYHEALNDRGKWRLPTHRELTLIWILHPSLMKNAAASNFTSMFPTSAGNCMFYSATRNANMMFGVRLQDGVLISDPYSSGIFTTDAASNLVRCVRDLDIK